MNEYSFLAARFPSIVNSLIKKIALFKKIVALGYLIQQKYRNDIRNMLP